MISIQTEQVITAAQAGNHVPSCRGGGRIHHSIIRRWWKNGCEAEDGTRVYLETIRTGGALCTSVEALDRFFERLSSRPEQNEATGGRLGSPQPERSQWPRSAYRERQDEEARRLANKGYA